MFITEAMAAGTEAVGEHAESGIFPPFDTSTFASQLFWLAITFGFFLWFMSKVIVPRIGNILETRQDRIAQDLDKAREFRDDADASIAAYEQELAEAKAKANEIGQIAREKANAEANAERAKVEAELGTKLSAAEARIADIREKAMSEVGGIAEEAASEIFTQLIGGTVTKADLAKAVAASGK
ncbi:F0F1 ATP synthase subunit B [Ahrensia kielensis]|uniref:ATP synthase subunit b n=1 Tax=Ahrensia kielensis TaxID=76980 RepID=A0ABU9T7Q8_9HYPH|nr:F0F1 ATP synthase subunit B [Ahrensia sp. 13_GOM-1096m]